MLTLAKLPHRSMFLVGVLPALLVLWIRRAVPEPDEWQAAKDNADDVEPGFVDLFQATSARERRSLSSWSARPRSRRIGHSCSWFAQHLRNLAGRRGLD